MKFFIDMVVTPWVGYSMLSQIKAQVPQALNGARFDIAAATLFENLSRKKIKTIIDRGGAYLNKKRIVLAGKVVSAGDVIELFWDEARSLTGSDVSSLPVAIIAEFENYVVVNKPAGLPSQATLSSTNDTVIHALQIQYPERFSSMELHLVHRLDKETSGVMLLAKSKKAQQHLEKLFQERKIHKVYHAISFGIPRQKDGLLEWPIRRDNSRANTYLAVMSLPRGRGASSNSKDV
ncbi:RluA family pseudouridine synthase, partial [bacterium]|nr:RluA family pseudouridine synthase [bacterium]